MTKKDRLVDILKEKRTALITRAVSKGLDPATLMRDSGIEWLREMPAHWIVKKWRYCCHITEGQVAPDDHRYRDRIMIAPNHIESGTGYSSQKPQTNKAPSAVSISWRLATSFTQRFDLR